MAGFLHATYDYITYLLGSLWGRIRGSPPLMEAIFPRLSSPHSSIEPRYDVVVVGSGYGGSIAACRCASAGQSVCVLERGKEWLPGEFPETLLDARREIQTHLGGKEDKIGKPYSLYEFYLTDRVSVVQGCGLGGGSLVNANVGLDAEPAVYQKPSWPKDLIDDLDNLLKLDRKRAVDMLKPTPYPDHYPKLHKLERMKDGMGAFDIEDIDKHFYKTPIYVTFEDKPKNHVGVPQPKCTRCGNCCGGCNVGAKNTLNLNYLSEAKAYGAEIFTKIEVMAVTKASDSNDWIVQYKRLVKGSFQVEEETIRATHVILGAGALGSTKLLLRSKERGLNVSSHLGKCFSTNGDALAFSYEGARETHSVGLETKDMTGSKKIPPGPCITSVMDFRRTRKGVVEEHFVIEDGTPPSVIGKAYSVALPLAAKEIDPQAVDKSLAFLCMSHDSASGIISYDKNLDSIDIDWDRVGFENNFKIVNEAVEKVAEELEGKFVKNPLWSDVFGKSVISAHPLGGCPMGESGQTAVVTHAGQVFEGDSSNVLNGLYVVDGAILPVAVGVNPTLTISCLAERCMRLLAKREGWNIDYSFKPLGNEAFVDRPPGICFTEKMVGKYSPSNDKSKQISCEFTLTIESEDVERMLNFDPDHAAEISGTVSCLALSSAPMTVSEGNFQLFRSAKELENTKEMVYKMVLTGDQGKIFSFHGVKIIHKDHFGETGLRDTTVLFVKIYQGGHFAAGDILGTATLYITFLNFAKQLATLEITNTRSIREKLHWTSKFGAFFAKTIWNVYGPGVAASKLHFKNDAQPRQRRPLRLNGCKPELHKCTTSDDFELLLTRYEGGKKGPVVLFHGAGVSSEIFSLDTIDTNLVEYLLEHRYDVWLVDWRTSCNLPSMVRKDYTLDDCAAFDYPAAIQKVLDVTKQENVQVVAHCAGSLVLFASLLSGALDGKVRSVVASQVAANPIPAQFNRLKAGLHLPGVMKALGVKDLTVDTDDYASFFDKLFNTFVKGVDRVFLPYDELCHNPVCHRISFIYGLLWEHENLNESTHDNLHEFFGYITSVVSDQLALTMREKKVVSALGKDIYLPDLEKGLESLAYREHINRLDLPICFIAGEENSCYVPESTLTTLKLVKEAHPDQQYSRITIPDYGHLDCIFGKDAVRDVYPHILTALEDHAQVA